MNQDVMDVETMQGFLKGANNTAMTPFECLAWAQEHSISAQRFPGPLSQWFKVFITTIDSVLAVFALLGNFTTLYIVYKIRVQNCRLSCLLGCLACSDILTVVVLMVFDLPTLWNDDFAWVLGEIGCKMAAFLQAAAILANSNTIIAIAVDRYLGIVKSPRQGLRKEWRAFQVILYILFIVILSFGLSVPYIIYYDLEGPYLTYWSVPPGIFEVWCNQRFCWSDDDQIHTFQVSLVCVIVVPLFVTFLICYGFLFHFLHHRRAVAGQSDSRQHARKRKVLVTVCTMMINFMVFRIPSWAFLLVPQPVHQSDVESRKAFSYIHYSLQALTLCASAINPFIYSLLHQNYRQLLLQVPTSWIRSASKQRVNPMGRPTRSSQPTCTTMATTTPDTTSSNIRSVPHPTLSLPNAVPQKEMGLVLTPPGTNDKQQTLGPNLYPQLGGEEEKAAIPWNNALVAKLSIVLEEEEDDGEEREKMGDHDHHTRKTKF